MEEENGDVPYSPRATVEDIQRRLLRPSSIHSSPPISSISSLISPGRNSSKSKAISTRSYREREIETRKKNKLEDYLDPVLLSEISSKIVRANKVRKTMMKRADEDFAWPADELRMLTEDSAVRKEEKAAVSLGNDSDHLNEDGEEGDDEFCICTPFRKFEQTRLKLFGL